MDLRPHIERFSRRYSEVEAALSDSTVFANPQRAQELSREYARLKELIASGNAYLKAVTDLRENRELIQSEASDSELAVLAREEISRLEEDEKRFALDLQHGIVPPDPIDSRNTILEIRAGAGGSESALFAADLYRMYTRYSEGRGWKVETLDSSVSDLGGLKEVIFSVTGNNVFKRLKYESGVHRVQRVPPPRRKAESTRARQPSLFCRKRKRWILRSGRKIWRSPSAARPDPEDRVSTRLTRLFRSTTSHRG